MSDFTVTTDKADYQPGETAVFSASNVEVGATAAFSVAHVNTGADGIYGTEDDLYTYDLTGTGITWTVTDGGEGDADGVANGVVTMTWYVNLDAANETFLLSATDTASGETATTNFTDAVFVPAVVSGGTTDTLFQNGDTNNGTGTGIFPAFVKIQGDSEDADPPSTDYDDDGDSSTEEGFNTDAAPVLDTGSEAEHNHSILLGDIPIVTIGGVNYREFRLDLNEPGNARPITLDSLIIYWDDAGNLTSLSGADLIYDIDAGGDISVALSAWQSGSGHADYKILIPEQYFIDSGVSFDDYIYLYSAFSDAGSGFEEWSVGITDDSGPDIHIDKVTTDADETGDDNVTPAGEAITWTYTITNTGNVALSHVVLSDDQLGVLYDDGVLSADVTFVSGDLNGNDILETTETWVFTIDGSAIAGSYGNIGTVTGEYLGEEVTDSDPSGYTGQGGGQDVIAIKIEKVTLDAKDNTTTAGDVADDFAAGSDDSTILVGEAVTWIYKVTNAGTVDLTEVDVTDDQGVTVTYLTGDDGDNVLQVGETWYYTASGVAVVTDEEGYQNIGTAVGRPEGGTDEDEVSDNDESGYFGANPSLSIEKSIVCDDGTTHDADDAETPILLLEGDGTVTYQIVIANTGNVDLTNVSVEDLGLGDLGDPVLTGDPDDTLDDILSVGETWTFTVTAAWAADGPHTNTATVDAKYTDTAGHVWEAGEGEGESDSATYFGAVPEIDVEKLVSVDGGKTWQDADTATGPVLTDVSPNDPMFKFVVHNTGNVALTNITLDDSDFGLNGTVGDNTEDYLIASLAADDGAAGGADEFELIITAPWAAGQHTDTATVSATFVDDCGDEDDVGDTDDANYLGFDVGFLGLTKGFWGQHLYAWDVTVATKKGQADTQALVNSEVLKYTDIFNPAKLLAGGLGGVDANGDGAVTGSEVGVYGVLLGDANGNFLTDDGENTLFVSLTAAKQIIQSSDSATDTRQILMSQALAAQLNIYNGVADPLDLVGEAVSWLKGQTPYTYADGSSGKVDTNGDGYLSSTEYNTTTKSFTFDANGSKAGTALTSNLNAWQTNVDVYDDLAITVMANGQDLKDALESFNQAKLITSADGSLVGWSTDGGVTINYVNDNTVEDNFWLTLSAATSWV